jgi:RNA polymerase sigma-70 factor (ECF subfamily)
LFNRLHTWDQLREAPDERVLEAALNDPRAFEVLVERYEAPLMRKALSILRHREDAEDVVQESFMKIYRHAQRFEVREGASFSSWAYRILVNTAINRYNKQRRERGRSAEIDPEIYQNLPDNVNEYEELERREYITSILAVIPEHLSRALREHMLENRPQEEIARREGLSVTAVKTRIHRAKKWCRHVAAQYMS